MASEFDFVEELDAEGPKQTFYKRLSFWRAAVPSVISFLALAAALVLLLVPQFYFTVTVRRLDSNLICHLLMMDVHEAALHVKVHTVI